ncbi:MAG: cell division protein ZapA [Gammaproteobacteria bacterium]|nr:cell division protein ZapA [Gammaproteobacteria bacterium]
MNSGEQVAVNIKIFDKEYKIACLPHEKDSLIQSARYLDQKMSEVKSSHKIIGADRIAVMAALNIASEFLNSENVHVLTKIKGMTDKLESAIEKLK